MIEIIDNVLPPHLQQRVYDEIMSDMFPWYWNDSTSGESTNFYGKEPPNTVEVNQLTHNFIQDGQTFSPQLGALAWSVVGVLASKFNLDIDNVKRVKANCMWPVPNYTKDNWNPIHADNHTTGKSMSVLYYVNDCDGNTTFFEELYPAPRQDLTKKFISTPKQNTAICFPSQMYHAGANPILNKKRVVVNCVFEIR